MIQKLPFADLETVYDQLAQAIDEAGPEQESLFLAKLCLALAHEVPDPATIQSAIASAKRDLAR